MITSMTRLLLDSKSTSTCRENIGIPDDFFYKIKFNCGQRLFIKKNRPKKEVPVNVLVKYNVESKKKTIDLNEDDKEKIGLRTMKKQKKTMMLLPKINKTTSTYEYGKDYKAHVLPEFKPISQVLGEKINDLDKKFTKITYETMKKMKCEERFTKPMLKRNRSVEMMRQPHSYKEYKQQFSRVYSRIKLVKD